VCWRRRGEIIRDPSSPVAEAKRIGSQLYDIRVTDYRLDTDRSNKVWEHLQSVRPETSLETRSSANGG
jgi:hypothetical protein